MYFQEEVRRQLFAMFGAERVLRGGLRVYSTYDPRSSRPPSGPMTSRDRADREDARARARPAGKPRGHGSAERATCSRSSAAATSRASSFNRATQARRQAGRRSSRSSMPRRSSAAMRPARCCAISTPRSPIPVRRAVAARRRARARPNTRLRGALKVSSNRAAAQLLQQVGLSTTVYYAQRMGIGSRAAARAVARARHRRSDAARADRGLQRVRESRDRSSRRGCITRVEDHQGTDDLVRAEGRTQAISATTAYLMSSMLSDVVSSGTAATARAAGFSLPAAGKTGTTDDYADAWFIGYTPRCLTGVWFGLDQPAPIMRGGFGGVVAVPAWAQFMAAATQGREGGVVSDAVGRRKGGDLPAERQAGRCALRWRSARRGHAAVAAAACGESTHAIRRRRPAIDVPPDPIVYEDLFPRGAMPSEICTLHDPAQHTIEGSTTPVMDARCGRRHTRRRRSPALARRSARRRHGSTSIECRRATGLTRRWSGNGDHRRQPSTPNFQFPKKVARAGRVEGGRLSLSPRLSSSCCERFPRSWELEVGNDSMSAPVHRPGHEPGNGDGAAERKDGEYRSCGHAPRRRAAAGPPHEARRGGRDERRGDDDEEGGEHFVLLASQPGLKACIAVPSRGLKPYMRDVVGRTECSAGASTFAEATADKSAPATGITIIHRL